MRGIISILVLIVVLTSCDNNNSTLELGNGNDVLVLMEVSDKQGINKIEFQANAVTEIATEDNLKNYKNILFGFEGKGEGTFKVCVYSISDTICSEYYVEGGYRPKLICTANSIDVEDGIIGHGYKKILIETAVKKYDKEN